MAIIKIFPTADELFEFAAVDFMQRAILSVKKNGIFSVILSGGSTPKLFFNTLAKIEGVNKKIPWNNIQFFFGDERYLPATNAENNFHMAYEYLFSKVAVKPENIYFIPTDNENPHVAAKQYEQILRQIFRNKENTLEPFDLVYLGLGDDAHTASLMPGSDVVLKTSQTHLVEALFVPKLNMHRITLTPLALNHSRNIIFLVTGKNKENAVSQVLQGPTDPIHYPAQLIHCLHGKTLWYLDQLAAGKLNSGEIVHAK